MSCKRRPSIRTYNVPAAPAYVDVVFGPNTAAFVFRARTAVGLQVALPGSGGSFFSLAASETYSEEDLHLDAPLELRISAAAAAVLEVWSWEG